MKYAMIGILILGIALVFAPIGAGIGHWELSGVVSALMLGMGGVLILFSGGTLLFTQLYKRARPDMAFVRTGLGGTKVIQNGGALVIPVVHEVVEVSLASMRLQVAREGKDALLTLNSLRANVKAEFYVHVDPTVDGLTSAARSLGDKSSDAAEVMALVEDKLVNALRSVAAKMTLEELNSDRDRFVKDVMNHITDDLNHNGLKLETVTISHLDQAPHTTLDENNIFDVQGLRTIAERTQQQLTLKNQLVRDGEKARLQADVANRQASLELEKTRAQAEAEQQAEVARIQAEASRASKQAGIKAEQEVKSAEIDKNKALAVKSQEQEEATLVAQQTKEKAVQLATIVKEQAVAVANQESDQAEELASRAREIAIADQNTVLALAETKRLDAVKIQTTAEQAITTVETVATAKRDQEKALITAEGAAQQAFVKTQKEADGEAYKLKALAEGKKAAADADAEATRKKAESEAIASQRRAEGEQALALVPISVKQKDIEVQRAAAEIPVDIARKQVEVDSAQVAVEQKRVDVLTQELKARSESGAVAQEFELAKLRISSESQVRIETAKAAATFGQKFSGTFVGTPDQLATLQQSMFRGMGIANLAEGVLANAGPETRALATVAGTVMAEAVTAFGKKENTNGVIAPTA